MRKEVRSLIFGLLLALFTVTVGFAQSGASTAKLQSAGNATAVALLNKIDTTTKVFVMQYTCSVTYSASGVLECGSLASQTWSIALGSQYWKVVSARLISKGNNYSTGTGLYFMNDSLNVGDNVGVTYTTARARKLLDYWSTIATYTMSSTFGITTVFGGNAYNIPQGAFTGNTWIYLISNGAHGISGNVQRLVVVFEKIKN